MLAVGGGTAVAADEDLAAGEGGGREQTGDRLEGGVVGRQRGRGRPVLLYRQEDLVFHVRPA